MLAVVLIIILCAFIIFFIPNYTSKEAAEEDTNSAQTQKLWGIAQSAIKERKPLKAEKALLTILKFDEKNAAAYNRLGIIYAKDKRFDDAIECFEIAQSLDNNASSLHNVGLIYYETRQFELAAQAFKHAIEIDGGEPARHIAYAKALEKLGKRNKAVESLEEAYTLKPDASVLIHLLELYENDKDEKNIELTKQRIAKLNRQKKKIFGYTIDDTSKSSAKTSRTDKDNSRTSARAAKVLASQEAKLKKQEALKKKQAEQKAKQEKLKAQKAKQAELKKAKAEAKKGKGKISIK